MYFIYIYSYICTYTPSYIHNFIHPYIYTCIHLFMCFCSFECALIRGKALLPEPLRHHCNITAMSLQPSNRSLYICIYIDIYISI